MGEKAQEGAWWPCTTSSLKDPTSPYLPLYRTALQYGEADIDGKDFSGQVRRKEKKGPPA